MKQLLAKIYDHRDANSWAFKLRNQRLDLFKNLLRQVDADDSIRILDIGGREEFWKSSGILDDIPDLEVTLLNVDIDQMKLCNLNLKTVIGDARAMPEFHDQEFDIVFSNSVIEHVGNANDKRRMSEEIRRVGKRYFIQTPNRFFPIEPHFVFPCFQFLPLQLQVWLIMNFKLGWYSKINDRKLARKLVSRITLLSRKEFGELFPGANMYDEKIFILTKSFIAYGGW
jgi:hypothetical protein